MKRQKKNALFVKILIYINIFAVLHLIIIYGSVYINPMYCKYIALAGMSYNFAIFSNLTIMLIWCFIDFKKILLSLTALLIGYSYFYITFNVSSGKKEEKIDDIKVLSFNVRLFDKYNWIKEEGTTKKILNFIEEQDADVMCFQEFYSSDKGEFDMNRKIVKFFKSKYSHISYETIGKKKYNYGIATYSKYPIVNKKILEKEDDNFAIYSDLLINSDTIRVFNCHLASVHLENEDYKFIDSITAKNGNLMQLKELKRIINKILTSAKIRAEQVKMIEKTLDSTTFPVIFCGDFNDVPISYVYKKISHYLDDAFLYGGLGFGSTYIYNLFSLRIDYIMFSNHFNAYNYQTHTQKISDHYPISCILKLN